MRQIKASSTIIILSTILLISCSSHTIVPTTVCGKVYPSRQDDLCWENEYVGFRAYGPKTQQIGEKMYGYDLFLKRETTRPIIENLVNRNNDAATWTKINALRAQGEYAMADSLSRDCSYHIDHGYGMDCYAVGPTLGAGVTAIIDSMGTIIYPWCYKDVDIIENGPKRFMAKLMFEPIIYDGDTIIEERIICLESGTNLNHTTVIYHGLTKPVDIVTGIVLHDSSPVTIDPEGRYMAYIDPTQGADNGQLFVGAAFPAGTDTIYVSKQDGVRHMLARNTYMPADTGYGYYWGYGWDRGNVPSFKDWIKILERQR